MKRTKKNVAMGMTLRQRAEQQLKQNQSGLIYQPLTEANMLKLIHELEVHQVELEIQSQDLMQARDAFHASAEKYVELYDNAPSGYLSLTDEGKITNLNIAASRMLGKERPRLKYKPLGFFMSNESLPLFSLFLTRIFADKEAVNCEITLATGDDRSKVVHLAGIMSENGEECRVIMTDITDQRLAEQMVFEGEARYKALFQGNHSVMLILDPDTGDIRDANQAASLYYGWSHIELCNMHITDINTLSQLDVLEEMKMARSEKRGHFNFKHRLASGEVRDVEVYSGPIKFGNSTMLYSLVHDITGQKKAEQALQKSEENYRLLVENQNDLVVKIGADGRLTYASPGYCRLFEKSESELTGKPFSPPVHPDDIEIGLASMMFLSQPPYTCYYEQRVMTADGWCWLAWSDKAILDEHNKVVAIVGVGRNITERKLAEEALYESNMELLAVNSQLETAQRIGLIGSWSYDPATRKLRGSAEAKRLFGQPLDDEHFTLARVEDCIPDRKRVHQALVDLVGKGIPYEIEYSINPADGSPQRIVLSRATLDADPEGKPLSVNGIIQDISARRQAEEAIRQSSNKWETLVSTTPDGIGMVSLDGKLLFMSDNLAEIYGYTSEEKNSCLGANVFDFIDPSCHQEMVDNIGNLAAGKSAYNLSEYLAVKKDSSRIQVELYSTLLSDAAGNPDKILYIERDITGRKEAENAIQRSEAMYRSILHASPDAVVITGLDGQILIISPITLSLLGYNDESQVVGLKLLEFLVPEDHEKALSEIGLMQQGLLNGPEEYQAIRADGTFLDIEVNGEIARKAEGRPDTMIFIIRDITGRKRAEAELFESKELLNSIVETALDSIFIKDLSLRYIKANSAMETLFGIPVGQILGKTDTDLFGIENAAHIEEIDRGVLAGVNFEEFPSKPVNGELRHFHTIKVPLKDVRGNVTGLCGIARDITERKVAEDNLRLSENRFLRAAEQTQTVIWEVDADGLYTYVSRHAKNVWGYDPGELTGKKHFYDLHPEEGREQFIKSAMDVFGRRATFQNFPNSIVTSNGDTIHVETNGTPLLDDQNNLLGYLGSDIDITERKKAEIEILDKTNLLTNLIINLQEGILLEDSNRKIILTNQLFCDMFGIPAPPEAMSGADCSDSAEQSKHYFTNPDTFIRDIVRILENKKTVLSDELELADGRCFERDYIPTFVEQEYSGHLWKYRDITERKRAERELGESQVKYRNLVENISDVIYEIGIDGIIKYISPPIEKILGYSPEEITGRNFIDFVGITAESLSSRLKMLPESKVLESEYKLVTKSGQPCWIRLSTTALFADGVYIGGSGTLIDITERKVAEEKLIRSEEGFRKLSRAVQQSPAMTCITGLQGIIEYVNPKVQEVTGYTEDELVGQNARILSSGEKSKEEYDLMWQIIRAGNEWKGEFHNKKKNGELYWVTAAITPILDGGGQITHYLAIEEDITARKIADKALQESEERLNYAQEIARMGSWTFDLITGKYEWSKNNFKMFGLKPFECEVSPEFFMNMIEPGDACELNRRITELPVTRQNIDMEFSVNLADGRQLWLKNYIVPLFDGDTMIGMNGVNIDITGKKRDEERISQQNERLNAIVTAMPDLIFVMDKDGNNLEHYTNSPEKLFISGEKIFGTNLSSFFDDDTTGRHLVNIGRCMEEQKLVTYDYAVSGPGELSYYEARMAPFGADKVLTFVRDITGRKQAEKEIRDLNATLALTVDERTAQLAETNKNLQVENMERIRATAAVEEALGRLHKIADRVPGVVYQYRLKPDGTSCFPYASEGIRAIYRVSPEDVLDDASTILSKLHPDDLNGVAESIQASARELTLWRHEYRVKFDDGVVRWMSGNAFPQREADGSVLWHGFISDITKRREAEEALLESQNRFALFMDYLPVIVFIKDNEGRTIYVNNTMDAALGASKWIGLKLTDIFDSDTAARILEDDQKTMKLGDQKIEESFIHLDGTIHHYETQKFIIPGFGKSPMLGGIALDITERKQAEDELKQLSTRLTMATRAGGVGVWDFDVETNSLFWDNQMLELYGIGKENFTGAYQTWLSGVHPDDRERGDQDIQAAILGEKEFDTEFRVVWPDGSVRNIKGQAVVQRDGSGRALHLIGTNWDITPQRRKEAFEKEILRLSVQLTGIRGSDLSSAIDLALGSIGHYLSADRAFVYEFKADNIISKTHEWCNHPVGPKIEKFTDLSVDYFPFPFDLLKRHENIVIPSVRSLPESRRKEREALESYGIKSIIVMPILVDNNLVGMVGLNMEAKEREYEPFEISNLVLWSNMLAGLIRNQKNELLLEQTRKNYETFFNTIDDFLFVLNEQGEIIQTNNTVVNRLGYSTPEMVDKSVLMVHPAERRQEAGRIVGEMLAGTADYCPVPLVAKSGILIPVETRVKPGFWDGNPVIFGVSKDVSKIKLSEEKFSKAFQSNSNLMAISGLDTGDFLDINDAFLNTLGYSRDEVIGKTTVEINLFADRDFRSTVIDSLKNHQRVRDIETQVNTKSGNVLMGLFSAEMIFIGSESSLLTVMVDITDRKLAEESLRSKMALLEAQKNATPDGLLVIDENQKRILVNKRIIEIFDVPGNIAENEDDAAMLSHVVSLTRYPEKFLEKVLYLNDHREETSRDEIEMKNGMILDRYSAPVLDAEGKSYGRIWSFRDVTESKRAEQEIIKARNEADQANLAKSEFLSRMSHELRTPMNSILGFAQLMDMGELKPAHRKGVHHILNSGKHLLNLINEVLDISRIEAGRLTLSPEPVQLRTMILETVDIIHQAAVQQQQTIVFADSPVSLLFVKADRQSLKQVLLNLLNNAVKYNKERGVVTIAASVSGKDVKAPPVVRISISDEGAGISAGDMGKLFLPFERIGAEKTATEGTGLGLTVVKKLMEAMGGIVGVDSMPGKGSTFWIELPETDSQKILFDKAGLNSIPEKVNAEITGTILYVEDNHSNTELVEEIILTHRPAIRLITTMLGKKAVKLALDNQPGLILLDLDLPDIPGIEVLADLREDPQTRAIPVVIVSADATIQEIEKLKKAGALGYLTKPIDIAAFLEVVDKIEIKPMKP